MSTGGGEATKGGGGAGAERGGGGGGSKRAPTGGDNAQAQAAAAGGGAAPQAGKGEGKEDGFGFTGQVLAAVVVTAVAGNILGARRFRKTMADTVSRNAQRRKAEADRAARAARERGPAAAAAGRGRGEGPLDGHPLRGRLPKGWSFDDAAEAAFTERRLNSQVVQHLSTLGVKNFVAGSEEVKAAYRGKAMSLHPDRNSSKGSERDFKKVAESYAWLDDNYFRKRGR